jgi:hypothetical protein
VDRQGRANAEAKRKQEEEDNAKRHRAQIQNELARYGGLTHKAAYEVDPQKRYLWSEAKRLGLIRTVW